MLTFCSGLPHVRASTLSCFRMIVSFYIKIRILLTEIVSPHSCSCSTSLSSSFLTGIVHLYDLSVCFWKYFTNSISPSQRTIFEVSADSFVNCWGTGEFWVDFVHALDSWCERYRSGTGARQSDRSGLWIKTRSALRLYFALQLYFALPARSPLRSVHMLW